MGASATVQSGRRIKFFRVSSVCFTSVLAQGKQFDVLEGLPEGSELAGVYFNHERDEFVVHILHPSFYPVPEGEIVPDGGAIVLKDIGHD